MPERRLKDAERLVEAIGIPPRPEVVMALMAEKDKDKPDLKLVAEAISRDVGISAALFKAVNSPFFGVQSIPQAVNLLGLSRIATLVTSLALKTSLKDPGIERFWDQSAHIAMLCAWLAGKLGHDRDSAHLFGLFRDAGIPLLMRRYPDYKQTLALINQGGGENGFTAVEDAHYGVNHAIVGGIVARNWNLPERLREAIQRHHDPDLFRSEADASVKNLVAIGHMAGQIESLHTRNQDDGEWLRYGESIMAWLMLGEDEVEDFTQEAGSLLLDSWR